MIPATVYVTIERSALADGTPSYTGSCVGPDGKSLGIVVQEPTSMDVQEQAVKLIQNARERIGSEPPPHAVWFRRYGW